MLNWKQNLYIALFFSYSSETVGWTIVAYGVRETENAETWPSDMGTVFNYFESWIQEPATGENNKHGE